LLLSREEILRVAISIGSGIEQRAIHFAGDVTVDCSKCATTAITVLWTDFWA